MNIEINLKDVCLDLLVVRKHVQCSRVYHCNRLFKAAEHMYNFCTCTCGCENMHSIFGREYMRRSDGHCCCLYIETGRKTQLGTGKQTAKTWFGLENQKENQPNHQRLLLLTVLPLNYFMHLTIHIQKELISDLNRFM